MKEQTQPGAAPDGSDKVGRIAFSWELYQSGRYIAECRKGWQPEEVVRMNTRDLPIIFAYQDGSLISVRENGKFHKYDDNCLSACDLFLIPKSVVKYRAIMNPEIGGGNWYYKSKEDLLNEWETLSYTKGKGCLLAIERITFIEGELPKVEVLDVTRLQK